jgi:broad specificity phosphatase PhoE
MSRVRVHLVRHGRAAAGWNVDPDPGLDRIGVAQAAEAAERLRLLEPCVVVTSPLRRCRETAQPLLDAWDGVALGTVGGTVGGAVGGARIEPRVAEIPSPEGVAMEDRVDWLRDAMRGTWAELGQRYTAYRDAVVQAMRELDADAVVFSHFIAINVLIGVALGDDRLVIRSLDNCSVTVVDIVDGEVVLVEGGHEADTLIR